MTISNVYLIFWCPLNLGALCGRTARTWLDTGLVHVHVGKLMQYCYCTRTSCRPSRRRSKSCSPLDACIDSSARRDPRRKHFPRQHISPVQRGKERGFIREKVPCARRAGHSHLTVRQTRQQQNCRFVRNCGPWRRGRIFCLHSATAPRLGVSALHACTSAVPCYSGPRGWTEDGT